MTVLGRIGGKSWVQVRRAFIRITDSQTGPFEQPMRHSHEAQSLW